MRISVVRGVIDRRILANYHIDPGVLARLLPAPFRLWSVWPRPLPAWLGIGSENAAHRAAVERDDGGTVREGVYIWRRDTGSSLNALAGVRPFPGGDHQAAFDVEETGDSLRVARRSDDGVMAVAVAGRVADRLPATSVFGSVAEASGFFATGSVGYSPAADQTRWKWLELRCRGWRVEPLEVAEVRSSFFDDRSRFPPGSVAFDRALLAQCLHATWEKAAPALPKELMQAAAGVP